jgi:hypothetical protein
MNKSLQKSILYNNALVKLLDEYIGKEETRDYYKKVVFLGTRCINYLPKDNRTNYEEAMSLYTSICFIRDNMAKLTYKEFESIFPIQKVYDGERWECKDYFYTRDYLKAFNEDDIIGTNIDELLWEYVNTDVRIFNTSLFMAVDNLRRLEGKRSMMEEWADMNGITTYTLNKDSKGKEYLYDRKNRRTIRVSRARRRLPKYLKVIK